MDMTTRNHFTTLLLRHESTGSEVERQQIRRRLRNERRSTILAALTCHLALDRAGASWHWRHYREASKVLHVLTADPRYITSDNITRSR